MERRLLKDFHIGIVEGIVNEAVSTVKEPKDVFAQIAKVIGRRTSSKHKKKDWNALVRKNTIAKDPIGTAQEAEMAQIKRQSLRKHILSSINQPVSIDHDKLIGERNNCIHCPTKLSDKKRQPSSTLDSNWRFSFYFFIKIEFDMSIPTLNVSGP